MSQNLSDSVSNSLFSNNLYSSQNCIIVKTLRIKLVNIILWFVKFSLIVFISVVQNK